MTKISIPEQSYGVLKRYLSESIFDDTVEQLRCLGYATLDSGYSQADLENISSNFDDVHFRYTERYGYSRLRDANEIYTIRAMLTHGGEVFRKLAMNHNLLRVIQALISGKFILNQQNGIINPAQEIYNQSAWHRDLPYQHFISSTPLAINALFCIDDFSAQNGATFVLPASHLSEAFPSPNYIQRNAVQIEAKAGSFILLDCMVFHAGGFNRTDRSRRAINHLFNIPFFKQQINIPTNIERDGLSEYEKEILGFNHIESGSIEEYLSSRSAKHVSPNTQVEK